MSTPPMRTDAPDDVLAAFHDIDGRLPEAFRAQVVDDEIVVTYMPDGEHEDIVADVTAQIACRSQRRMHCSGHRGLVVPRGRYIPDLTVAPAGHFRSQGSWAPADGVAMVVEVTTVGGDRDRLQKRLGYAIARVPLYLLVDRAAREVALYARPDDGAYRAQIREPFGKGLELPPPFAFTLETSEFGVTAAV
jgi:Uma2 family endonuclease